MEEKFRIIDKEMKNEGARPTSDGAAARVSQQRASQIERNTSESKARVS